MKAQCLQLINRVARFTVRLVADETIEGKRESEIGYKLMNVIQNDEKTVNDSEKIPNIGIMKELLIPNNQKEIEYIKKRLGYAKDEDSYIHWSSKKNELLNGLEYLSSSISKKLSLTSEHKEIIDQLTRLFDILTKKSLI